MANEIWWTSPAESENGKTILVSGRDDVAKYRDSGKYIERVEIIWRYKGDMPGNEDAALLEQADDALRAALKDERRVVLTGVYTGDGERDWVFYVRSTQVFQNYLNRAWAELPLFPVEIRAENDPEWAEYDEMRELTYIPPAD